MGKGEKNPKLSRNRRSGYSAKVYKSYTRDQGSAQFAKEMYRELENRSPERFAMCLRRAFLVLFLLFAGVMVGGYIAFGSSVQSNFLNNLPNDAWSYLARLAMGVSLIAVYPLHVYPFIAPIVARYRRKERNNELEEAIVATEGQGSAHEEKPWMMWVVTISLVIISTVGGLYLNNLGKLNAVNGSIQVIGYVGLMPGVAGMYLLRNQSAGQLLSYKVLIAFSIFSCIIGLIFIDNNAQALQTRCLW